MSSNFQRLLVLGAGNKRSERASYQLNVQKKYTRIYLLGSVCEKRLPRKKYMNQFMTLNAVAE